MAYGNSCWPMTSPKVDRPKAIRIPPFLIMYIPCRRPAPADHLIDNVKARARLLRRRTPNLERSRAAGELRHQRAHRGNSGERPFTRGPHIRAHHPGQLVSTAPRRESPGRSSWGRHTHCRSRGPARAERARRSRGQRQTVVVHDYRAGTDGYHADPGDLPGEFSRGHQSGRGGKGGRADGIVHSALALISPGRAGFKYNPAPTGAGPRTTTDITGWVQRSRQPRSCGGGNRDK
jgi:hypothetical protein